MTHRIWWLWSWIYYCVNSVYRRNNRKKKYYQWSLCRWFQCNHLYVQKNNQNLSRKSLRDNRHFRLYLDRRWLHACWKDSPRETEKNFSSLVIFITPLSSLRCFIVRVGGGSTLKKPRVSLILKKLARIQTHISHLLSEARSDDRRREKMRASLDFNPMEF